MTLHMEKKMQKQNAICASSVNNFGAETAPPRPRDLHVFSSFLCISAFRRLFYDCHLCRFLCNCNAGTPSLTAHRIHMHCHQMCTWRERVTFVSRFPFSPKKKKTKTQTWTCFKPSGAPGCCPDGAKYEASGFRNCVG